jgi:CHAD domain-containing protein
MNFRIERKEPVPAAIRRIAQEQLLLAAKRTSGKKLSATSIHSARKAIKRTRAVLQLLRCAGNAPTVREEDHALRDAARLIAAERDLHVQWIALKRVQACKKGDVCRVLRERLQSRQAKQKPESADQLKRFNDAVRSVQLHLPMWPTADVDQEQLALALKRSYRRTRKCFKQVREAPVGAKLHNWRKAAKSFWYHLQLTDALASKKLRKLSEQAHDLTRYLGDEHDLYLLLTALAGANDPDSRAVKREIRKVRSKLQKRAFRIARRTFDLAPSAFHERISRCLNQAKN